MGDPQFQQFIKVFESMPQHIRAPEQCYRLVPDIDLNDSPEREMNGISVSKSEDIMERNINKTTEKKRRKLPQIPKNKKPLEGLWDVVSNSNAVPLSEELSNPDVKYYSETEKCLIRQISTNMFLEIRMNSSDEKPVSLKLYSRDQCLNASQSPDAEDSVYIFGSDSGNSSAMSPTDESVNGIALQKETQKLKLLEATHRGLYPFIPRHKDELRIQIGDPVYVSKENDDFWCEGINLKTGLKGIFPSALVTDVEYSEFVVESNCDDSLPNINFKVKKERYLLDFLGSVEVMAHKGNPVLCESVRRVLNAKPSDIGMETPQPLILEITDLGIRLTDKTNNDNKLSKYDYFFALKHITFCGYYPENNRYFCFITKHPTEDRLASHVLSGKDSTRDVAEAVGRAFHRFYNRFIELSYPIEEFYFE